MDDFIGSLFSRFDPDDNRRSNDESAIEEDAVVNTVTENDNERDKEEDLCDLREENLMLRTHMEELNKHVIRLTNSDKLKTLQKELEHANGLRSSGVYNFSALKYFLPFISLYCSCVAIAEAYVISKNAELKHLHHLINEQITKTQRICMLNFV